MGVILAIFNLSGNMPLVRDWFTIVVKGFRIGCFISFNSLVEIPS